TTARTAQRIAKRCGHLIRTEIVAFFARTQQPIEVLYEAFLFYRFTKRQRKAWNALWSLATDHNCVTPMDALIPTPFHFRPIETACLNFCIELLNQRIGADEYECALVCVLALLGRSRIGWYTPDSFPSILSKIVKLVRFMVLG
ncbi:unnamed protein product, partial [Penicillium salamii]